MIVARLVAWLARLARGGLRAIAAVSLLPLLLSVYAFTVPLDFSFSGVMDRSHPEVARYFDASERYGLGGLLPLLVKGPEARLDEAVAELRRALEPMDEVRSVMTEPPREWLLARAPFLVERAVFESWVALARAPVSLEDSRAIRRSLEELLAQRAPRPVPGSRLVVVTMARDTFELALDADDFPAIRRVVGRVLEPFDATGRFAGMAAIVTQEQEATIERMRVLAPASLVLVLLVLLLIERRLLVLFSIGVPILLSVGCTLGIVGLVAGELTIMESIFGVIVFGLGVDFAIHLLLRVREERAAGRDFAASMDRALRGTGPGVVAGAVTTGGALLILAFAPDPVFYRLGLAGGLGMLLCLVLLLTLLPPAWEWIDRRSSAAPAAPRTRVGSLLGRVAGAAERAPAGVLIGGAMLIALSAAQLPALRYETNLERVFSRDIDAVHTGREIHERFGVDAGPWLVAAQSLGELRRLTRAFEAEPVFERTESLAYLFPPDLDERQQILSALVPELARRVRERELAVLDLPAARGKEARAALEPLALLLGAAALGSPTRDSLPAALAERFIGPREELLLYAFAAEPALDSAVAGHERRVAQAIDPDATSMSAIYEALIGTDRPWMPPIVAAVGLFIALFLYLDLRSVRLVAAALLPVTAATVVTLGVLAACDFSFNTVTLVAVPLLLGLGVDDGIHVVHRMLDQPEAPLGESVGAVARSIAMTTLTTCASVGLLLFTRHPGIESISILLLVGLPLCLLASATLLPAAAVALRIPAIARARGPHR